MAGGVGAVALDGVGVPDVVSAHIGGEVSIAGRRRRQMGALARLLPSQFPTMRLHTVLRLAGGSAGDVCKLPFKTDRTERKVARDRSKGDEAGALYRMAHESAIAWIANERARLEANITRSAGFMALAVFAMGAGIGFSTTATPEAGFGTLTWSGIVMGGVGVAACFLATARLMWPLDVPELDPRKLIEEYEHQPSDAIYRDIAVAGADAGRELSLRVNRRCKWLYVSMVGFPLVVGGVLLLWASRISM